MTKNVLLFMSVAMIIMTGVMSVSSSQPVLTDVSTVIIRAAPTITLTVTPTDTPVPIDTVKPVITIIGANPATITVGTVYIDEGATATDNVDGDITSKIQSVNGIDTNIAGTYYVTYDVSDIAGNKAIQKIRTVNVNATPIVDTIPPTIVPQSNVTIQATGVMTSITLVTPVVTDNVDTSPAVTNNAPIGSNFPIGNTVITWTACDHTTPTPNCNTVIQLVTVVDTTPPFIIPPPDVNIRATGSVTHVTLGNATASDLVDPSPIITNYAPAGNNFPVGNTSVMWKACDHYGNCNTTIQYVTVLSQGAIITAHNPQLSINRTAPSTVEFNITIDQVVNVIWSFDGINVTGNNDYSVTYASYTNTVQTIGNHVVTANIENENGSYYESWNWNVRGGLNLSANMPSVNVGQPTNVIFTVTRKCGIESSDNSSCIGTVVPVIGANVSLTGVSYGTGITDANGQTTILVNGTSVGTVIVTASYSPVYNSDITNITIINQSSSGSGGSGSSGSDGGGNSDNGGGSNSGSGGGGGGGGTAEPYDNILKYEVQERSVYTTPVSFKYTIPELGIYDVWITSTQSNIASLRIEALKSTSKLVGSPAPGIVYKNINAWIDYKRIKNATIKFKVENSWISDNGLSADNIKMSTWDNDSRKWNELLTNRVSSDDKYTYFDSQTDSFSSFAINGVRAIPVATVNPSTPVVTANIVSTSPEPINASVGVRKDSTWLQVGIVGVVIVLIFYMLRLKK